MGVRHCDEVIWTDHAAQTGTEVLAVEIDEEP
jgi:hypothetical protein